MGSVALLASVLLAMPFAAPLGGDLPVRRTLHAAGVVVETTGCSGVVAEHPQIIVTARHCVEGEKLRVRLSTGAERTAWVGATSDASDQAVLFLEEPAGVEPLPIVRRRQIPGTLLYFEGNPGHPRFQSARLDRIGVCPSLPHLPDALFTSIQGVPGDSGAPLVDGAARIVGLVHGGAQCHIATPSTTLAHLVDQVLARESELTRVIPPSEDRGAEATATAATCARTAGGGTPPSAAYEAAHAVGVPERGAPRGRIEGERGCPASRRPSTDPAGP